VTTGKEPICASVLISYSMLELLHRIKVVMGLPNLMNQPALVAQTMCPLCQNLPLATAGTQPHAYLRLQGSLPVKAGAAHAEQEDRYRCITCYTVWLRRTDRWGMDTGFRLAP